MSRIIILAEPVEGHFNPFIPIITQLVARGHQVVCMTGRLFKARVENIGATFHPLPEKWDIGDKEAYDVFPELKKLTGLAQIKFYIKHVMYDQIPDVLKTLDNLLNEFPADVVIGDTFMVAATWITEIRGIPNVRLSVLPLSLPGKDIAPFGLGWLPGKSFLSKLRNNLLNVLFEKVLFSDVQRYINQVRQQVGLPAYEKYFFTQALALSNLVLHTSTPAFEYARNEFPPNFRFIGPILIPPNDSYTKPDWWPTIEQAKHRPVVLINQGTIAKNYADLILPAIAALKDEDMLVLAIPVKAGEIKQLPSNTYTARYVPFGNLLPHVDVMITNGGFGGTQNALAHGIPLVIAGATEDKMEVAARLENWGRD